MLRIIAATAHPARSTPSFVLGMMRAIRPNWYRLRTPLAFWMHQVFEVQPFTFLNVGPLLIHQLLLAARVPYRLKTFRADGVNRLVPGAMSESRNGSVSHERIPRFEILPDTQNWFCLIGDIAIR